MIVKILMFFTLHRSRGFAQEDFWVFSAVVDVYPTPSPNGSKIPFTSNKTVTYQIHLCDLDGKNLTQLTNVGSNVTPVWSPDGNKIVFASERDNDSEIYIMHADSTEQKRSTSNWEIIAFLNLQKTRGQTLMNTAILLKSYWTINPKT